MNSKPLNRETFNADVRAGALVVCNDIDSACELLKGALRDAIRTASVVTFTTDGREALTLASFDPGRLVFTLGKSEAVITF